MLPNYRVLPFNGFWKMANLTKDTEIVRPSFTRRLPEIFSGDQRVALPKSYQT